MNKNLLIGFSVMTLVIVSGIYFGAKDKPVIRREKSLSKPQNTTSQDFVYTREIFVEASEFSFTPTSLNAGKGEKVRIWLTNNGTSVHNISVPDANLISEDADPGDKVYLDFVSDKPGSFSFYCGMGGHKDLGMNGIIIVK